MVTAPAPAKAAGVFCTIVLELAGTRRLVSVCRCVAARPGWWDECPYYLAGFAGEGRWASVPLRPALSFRCGLCGALLLNPADWPALQALARFPDPFEPALDHLALRGYLVHRAPVRIGDPPPPRPPA